jgi:DNA-binding MarR family transcriptional regulator
MITKTNLNGRLDVVSARLKAQEKDIIMDNFLSFVHTSDMVLNYLDGEIRKTGLNRTQLSILTSLVINGGTMMPTQLSRIVLRSKYATIKAIDGLEKLKITKSERAKLSSREKSDRRLRKVTITEKGLELLENTMSSRHQLGSNIMGNLSKKESAELKSILFHMRKHLLDQINCKKDK